MKNKVNFEVVSYDYYTLKNTIDLPRKSQILGIANRDAVVDIILKYAREENILMN